MQAIYSITPQGYVLQLLQSDFLFAQLQAARGWIVVMDGEVQNLLLSGPAANAAGTAYENGFRSGSSSFDETIVVKVPSQVFHAPSTSSG